MQRRDMVRKVRFPLQLHLATIMVLMLVVTCAIIAIFNYQKTSEIVSSNQRAIFSEIGENVLDQTRYTLNSAQSAVLNLRYIEPTEQDFLEKPERWLIMLSNALELQPFLSSIYVGFDNGSFYLVRRFDDQADSLRHGGPLEARYSVNQVLKGKGEIQFYTEDLQFIADPLGREYTYDPRERPWYQLASEQQEIVVTSPYRFFTSQDIGMTLAIAAPDKRFVVGADITLVEMSKLLQRHVFTPSTELVVYNDSKTLLAHSNPSRLEVQADNPRARQELPNLNQLDVPVMQRLAQQQRIGEFDLKVGSQAWRGDVSLMEVGVADLYLGIVTPLDELLGEAKLARDTSMLLSTIIMVISIPIAWMFSRMISKPLRLLKDQSEAIMSFDFAKSKPIDSMVQEIYQLSNTTERMKATIEQFAEVSTIVGEENSFQRLLQRYLDELNKIVGMPTGAIWLAKEDGYELAAQRGEKIALPEQLNDVQAARQPLVASLLNESHHRRASMVQVSHQQQVHSAMICPLIDRQRKVIGLMVMLGEPGTLLSRQRLSFLNALSGVITVAVENRQLIDAQKQLMQAFIELIADAIDAKSPYTGAHCKRVPELTKMLARAAQYETQGEFASFSLNDDQWEELHIASWLHDCGKVTTPEYVVDKATKLETIYDRIHEVRMRFEVLKRDAQLEYWQARAQGKPADKRELEVLLRELDEEFAFVANCNQGGEFMEKADIARLKTIGQRRWLRTLDDRLGLSHLELDRLKAYPAKPLPHLEALLDNKDEHCQLRTPSAVEQPDNPWGFKLNVPEFEYNRGELHNLSIARGTLTEEERYKINDHIVQTIIMLEQLPFPSYLSNVPAIAGGHHEKMDGSGYPRCLMREQMPVTARMMAVADIFEALTASDRPYKKGKTLSQALKIMSFMAKDEHIDPALFRLFLERRVYESYAKQFLDKEQIDEVDISDYLPQAKSA